EEIAQRCGVLVGRRRVRADEAATVAPEQFDERLRAHRSARYRLLETFRVDRIGVGMEILRYALRDVQQRTEDREGQHDVEHATGQVDPEIPKRRRTISSQRPDKADCK